VAQPHEQRDDRDNAQESEGDLVLEVHGPFPLPRVSGNGPVRQAARSRTLAIGVPGWYSAGQTRRPPVTSRWTRHDMSFLEGRRPRRLRQAPWMRDLVRETSLSPADFIWPLFVIEGHNERSPVKSMPGVERLSLDLCGC